MTKKISKNKKKVAKIAMNTIPILVVFLFEWLGFLNYNMADDYIMNTISAGFQTGTPNEHIVFINSIYGILVKGLYSIIKSINWFGMGYLVTMLLCIYVLKNIFDKKVNKYISLLAAIILEMVILTWMTFTVLAYLCVITGIIVFLQANYDYGQVQNIKNKSKIILAVVIEALGIIFRIDAFVTGIIVCIPLLVCLISKKNIKTYLIFGGTIIILLVGFKVENNLINSSSTMKEYLNYNNARSNVLDFPMKSYDDLDKKIISENDYKLLEGWILSDKDTFSEKALQNISDEVSINEKYNFNLINIICQMLKVKECWIFLAIILIVLISNRRDYKYYVIQTIMTYGIVAATFFRSRPAHRVIVPLFIIGTLCILFYFITRKETNIKINKAVGAVLVIILPVLVLYLNMEYRIYRENREINDKYYEVKEYVQNNKNTLYATTEIGNMLYHNTIWKTKTDCVYDNVVGLGDWNIYNDVYYQVVKKYNLTDNNRLINDLVWDENVKCILSQTNSIVDLLKVHIEEQTGKKVDYKIIKKFDASNTAVYEFYYNEN